MKWAKAFLFVLVLAAAAAAAGYYFLKVPFGPTTETFVEIEPGTGTPGIATQLQQAGIIRSRYAFEAYAKYQGGVLRAGEYRFDHPATVADVYARVHRGDVFTITLVIPEGYNLFEIARAVQAAGLGTEADFLTAAHTNAPMIAAWSPTATSLEGYLFPDTYKFPRKMTVTQIQSAMIERFRHVTTRLGMVTDISRIVTIASLVEKEVHVDSERALVAGVFENRLARNMPLQTDPAVIYASMLSGTWTGVIHQSELHSDSPYNTYAHPGLPPGPICNPGTASLKAAMNPAKTPYLYFVADAHGNTRFAASLQEHNQNVTSYRAEAGLPPAAATKPAAKPKPAPAKSHRR